MPLQALLFLMQLLNVCGCQTGSRSELFPINDNACAVGVPANLKHVDTLSALFGKSVSSSTHLAFSCETRLD